MRLYEPADARNCRGLEHLHNQGVVRTLILGPRRPHKHEDTAVWSSMTGQDSNNNENNNDVLRDACVYMVFEVPIVKV